MENQKKIKIYKALDPSKGHVDTFIDALKKTGDIKFNYEKYMTTAPVDAEKELLRTGTADYDTACASHFPPHQGKRNLCKRRLIFCDK
jgi:hypothetical protein